MRPGHYRDPRGHLHEPHTKKSVPLGTREVAGYEFPDHVYDKILYVEKEGLGPIFQAANLAERYDMAICAGKGQPVEATRELFERAEAGDYKLFVLHDADPAGYSIARTISEETERMPDYGVDVIDVGLSVGDAIRLGLQTETFYRKAALPWWMPSRLDAEEASWFHPRRTSITCTRVELNALGTGIVGYVEGKLADHGADGKLVPPSNATRAEAEKSHQAAVRKVVDEAVQELLDLDNITETLVGETIDEVIAQDDPDRWVVDAYAENRASYWRDGVKNAITKRVEPLGGRLRGRLNGLLRERIDQLDEGA